MAAETDPYEDNPTDLNPQYYPQRDPIASTLYDNR